mmetsp:Transcript_37638/g.150095  ORF Transcript_37638/g.150095 Transcript_37638/m.150095 type:complete len:179 (-) Transcript_37638:1495-2031(-)
MLGFANSGVWGRRTSSVRVCRGKCVKIRASKGDEDVEDVSGDESNRNRPVSSGAESNGGVPPETSTPSSEEQPGSANEPVHRISPFASDITPNPNGLPNPVEELELESSKEVSSLESVDRAKSQLRRLLPYVINLDRQRAKVCDSCSLIFCSSGLEWVELRIHPLLLCTSPVSLRWRS